MRELIFFPFGNDVYICFFLEMKELHEANGNGAMISIRLRLGSSKGAARRLEAHQSRTQFLSSKRCAVATLIVMSKVV